MAGARSYRRLFAMLVLLGEALVVGFATLVAKDLSGVGRDTALLAGALLALLCVVTAGLLRLRVGYAIGWAVQILLLASAIWVPVMLLLGAVFGALLTPLGKIVAGAPPADMANYVWNATSFAIFGAVLAPVVTWAGLRRAGHISDTFGCAIALADIRIAQGRLGVEMTDEVITAGTEDRLRVDVG